MCPGQANRRTVACCNMGVDFWLWSAHFVEIMLFVELQMQREEVAQLPCAVGLSE